LFTSADLERLDREDRMRPANDVYNRYKRRWDIRRITLLSAYGGPPTIGQLASEVCPTAPRTADSLEKPAGGEIIDLAALLSRSIKAAGKSGPARARK
jgi:hypothetical protein